ncbi:hypothetical protein KIW84_022749 [Lathyrus oleraceus]|uniref:Uncharacterized protein n=1 Tax=Pisum sativum TaxID=3888 RepID=A0A9D5BB33_PEA|nr:hypothetical protein KIW84_022749 [Pisum sativum]
MDPVGNDSATVHYDFENPIYHAEDGSEEDCEVPGELARLVLQEEKTIQPHEESIEIVNLGTEIDEKEVRGFLGHSNYIARFIPHLTATCKPIFKLLKRKNQEMCALRQGATPFSLVYGMEAVLPVEVQIPSLRIMKEAGLDEEERIQTRLDQINLIEETCGCLSWTDISEAHDPGI